MSSGKRKWFIFILKPFIKALINKAHAEKAVFKEGQMITGLYGFAKK